MATGTGVEALRSLMPDGGWESLSVFVDASTPTASTPSDAGQSLPHANLSQNARPTDMRRLSRIPHRSQRVEHRSDLFEEPSLLPQEADASTRGPAWFGCLGEITTRKRAAMHMQKSKPETPLTSKQPSQRM